MYTCIAIKGVLKNGDRSWVDIAVDKLTLRQLFIGYVKLQATLTNKVLPKPVYLDLMAVDSSIASYDITIQNWLNSLGNASLPTTDAPAPTVTKYVRYADAFRSGYHFLAVAGNAGSDVALPEADKTWLRLNKEGMDPTLIGKTTLGLVNGLYHQTAYDPSGFYIVDAMRSARISRNSLYGLVTFADIGNITQIPIDDTMIYKQKAETPLSYRTFINAKQDLSAGFVFIVIGGYLHPVDNKQITRISDRSFCIDFENIPLLQRFYESRDKIDLSSLKLDVSVFNSNVISRKQFLTDDVIKAYLKISQSFIVVLDNPNVDISYESVNETKTPGVYFSYKAPIWPLVTKSGRHSNYLPSRNRNDTESVYTLRTADSFSRPYLFATTSEEGLNVVDNQTIPFEKVRNAAGFFMKIATA